MDLSSIKQELIDRHGNRDSLYGTKFHNTWRAIRFTPKGKKIGCCQEWMKFSNFRKDMFSSYQDDYRLSRLDKKQPFSAENCRWVDKSTLSEHKLVKLEHNGVSKTLYEWALECDKNYNGIRQRFFRGKNYTSEQIIYGKLITRKTEIKSAHDLERHQVRAKASKMISQYRLKDAKRRYTGFDLTIEWMIDNILYKSCTYCGTKEKVGADRISNKEGHTRINCVPCCFRCNSVRGNHFTHEEMLSLGQFIRYNIDTTKGVSS